MFAALRWAVSQPFYSYTPCAGQKKDRWIVSSSACALRTKKKRFSSETPLAFATRTELSALNTAWPPACLLEKRRCVQGSVRAAKEGATPSYCHGAPTLSSGLMSRSGESDRGPSASKPRLRTAALPPLVIG